jgi:hypothetical protein
MGIKRVLEQDSLGRDNEYQIKQDLLTNLFTRGNEENSNSSYSGNVCILYLCPIHNKIINTK